jgi:hypothetical protein
MAVDFDTFWENVSDLYDDIENAAIGAGHDLDSATSALKFSNHYAPTDLLADASTIEPPSTVQIGPKPDITIPEFDDSGLVDIDPIDLIMSTRYDSEFLEYLEQDCRSILEGNIPGFTQETAQSLFQWREEQDQRDLQIALHEADTAFGVRRGFPIPPDSVSYKKNEIFRTYNITQLDRTRETVVLLAERLTDMTKTALATGVNIEDIRGRLTTVVLDSYWRKYQAMADVYRAQIAGIVAEFEGEIKYLAIELEEGKLKTGNELEFQKQIWTKANDFKRIKATMVSEAYRQAVANNATLTQNFKQYGDFWSSLYSSVSQSAAGLFVKTEATEAPV